jgi:hypothetical protein
MIEITSTEHVLERTERGQIWMPARDEWLSAANRLIYSGSLVEGLILAESSHIEVQGNMHGVAYRVRSTKSILTGLGNHESVTEIPDPKAHL